MTVEKALQMLKERALKIINEDSLEQRLKSGKKLIIKLGADPSRPDLHLGHAVVLNILKIFQDLGHTVVFVIGDFTGMVGDPSGKSKTRPNLTFEETRANAKSYISQVSKILDSTKTQVTFNSEWLSKMTFKDVIKLGSHYTVAQILERDDFSKRFKNNIPISVHEMLYPLMQAYDSVNLQADVELGGNDQLFNLLVGRELQKVYGQKPQEIIVSPLLVGLDGVEKMSKSLDNYIGITEPANIMFEKCMRVPDKALLDYFKLTTEYDLAEAKKEISKDIRNAHFIYARYITTLYHNQQSAKEAEERYLQVAKGITPDSIREFTAKQSTHTVLELVMLAGFAKSTSEARRLIQGNGIKLNGAVVTDFSKNIEITNSVVLSKGKNKFVRFTI